MAPKRRTASRVDHETFCQAEGWEQRKTATGRRGTHHVNYEFALPDGRILYTRISHPVDRTDYGPSLWGHILRDQLEVNDEEFWACVEQGALPERGVAAEPEEAIPAEVAYTLITRARIPESEVRAMSRTEALARLADYYSRPSD